MKYVVFPALMLAAIVTGQTWVVEQMDSTAVSQSPVELVKAADGRVWVGYGAENGIVRVACLSDSGWVPADICSGYVATNTFARPFLAAGPHGELCLSCVSSDSSWLFRMVRDTWQREPYPFTPPRVHTVAYDTAGRLYTCFSPEGGEFWVGHETDSGWTSGLVADFGVYGYWIDIGLLTVAQDASPWFVGYRFWMYGSHSGQEAALMHFSQDTWASVWRLYGEECPVPVGLTPNGDSVGVLTDLNGFILCDNEPITSISDIPVAGLTYSSIDVPLVAWVPLTFSAAPMFAFKTNRWHTESIPGPAGIGGLDIETDTAGQVIIVYSTEDSGLWCARGTDVVGTKEVSSAERRTTNVGPTILAGASAAKRLASSVVFDAMGRRVTNPKPGVYFVREAQAQAKTIRKVVIQR